MITSTTKNKIVKALKVALPIIFWLIVYEVIALIIDRSYFFPRLSLVLTALISIVTKKTFFTVCTMTLLRVLIALLLGTVIGIALGIISAKSDIVYSILNPFMSAVKATPVASLIIVLWIMLDGDSLSIMIALFMVMPIIWQSTYNSFEAVDRGLLEVANVFEMSPKFRFATLYMPNLKKFLIPSLITSVGLAWKSEIATEIIAYTRNSIGQLINDGKYNLDTPSVFAWTLIVIVFSIIFEAITKTLLGRVKI